MAEPVLRRAVQDDLELLWGFLAIAAYEPDAAAARTVPVVALHLRGWQRPGDFGFVAKSEGIAIGAAWARQFTPEEAGLFYVDQRTPEMSLGVIPSRRGQGIGAMLLRSLAEEAVRRHVRLCLNVRHDNPARRLYGRAGFREIPGAVAQNRVGGLSIGMILDAL